MRFPFTELRPGLFRPIAALRIYGPVRRVLVDGLLDTGSDRTLLPPNVAIDLGLDINTLSAPLTVLSATGQRVACRTIVLPLELARNSSRLCWLGEIAVTADPLRICHWGFKGFLEYFHSEFDGPGRSITLTAGANLPVVVLPV